MKLRYWAGLMGCWLALTVVSALRSTMAAGSSGWLVFTALVGLLFLSMIHLSQRGGQVAGYRDGWHDGVLKMHEETVKALDAQREVSRVRTAALVAELQKDHAEMCRILGLDPKIAAILKPAGPLRPKPQSDPKDA
jgi:hypothetical protein